MNKTLLITSLGGLLALNAGAQVLNQWNFSDTSGTSLTAAGDSVGSATFSNGTNGGGTFQTNGSGFLVGSNRMGNADIADQTTGIFQYDLTGITFTAGYGTTSADDSFFFGIRDSASSTITNFTSNSGSFDEAVIVIGNDDSAAGVDWTVYDNGSNVGSGTNLGGSTDFSGTWDFRIVLDLDNDTADYFYQVNGGGYNTIVSQQFNGVGTITHIALGSVVSFNDTVSIDQATWSAVPEPSAYALIAGTLALSWIMVRRRG